jgi:O-antigen/teichoic acid export membrane protein
MLSIGWPGLNLAGAALGTVCGSGMTAVLNLFSLRKLVKANINFMPSVGAGLIMLLTCGYIIKTIRMNYILEMIIAGGGSLLVYLITLRFLGGIENSDLEVIGKLVGEKGK